MSKIEKNKILKIRDLRRKDKYTIDDEYLNGYARLCLPNATAVYNSLCRHASKDQECYPSMELIMEQHGFKSKHTVIKAIRKLEEWGIIQVKREKDEKTKRQLKNVYLLCDKSEWKPKPSALNAPRAECISDAEPGASDAQKPSAPDALEGYTEKKDSQLRTAADAADGSENSRDKEDRPMNLQQFVEWCSRSPQKHIQIIGEWAETTGPQFETVEQWEAYIKRYLRPARNLVPFSREQLETGFQKIKDAKYLDTVTLETLFKYITNAKIK